MCGTLKCRSKPGKGFAGVDAAVGRAIAALSECLAAHGAFVGLLASVDPAVGREIAALSEFHAAHGAFVGLLASVDPAVALEIRRAPKSLGANGADMRLFGRHCGVLVRFWVDLGVRQAPLRAA